MCEYYERHGCERFLKGKPIRFGFKIWCETTPLGHLIWFDSYQGKSALSRLQDNGLGLGGNLVSHFADVQSGCGRKFFYLFLPGRFDFKTDTKNDVLVCKWNDNSVVNLCSNAAGVHPISKASRYSSSEKKRVQIDHPLLIKLYNKHMEGVDRMDQNVSKY